VGRKTSAGGYFDILRLFRGPFQKLCCHSITLIFWRHRSEKVDRAQNHRQISSASQPARCAPSPLYVGPRRTDSSAAFWRAP
jgi:hypothetical protein